MKEKINKIDCGILIGRFQIHELHDAHIDLIKTVLDKHDRVIIFLGNGLVRNTVVNPLDFRARKTMINEKFPNVEIHYINDVPGDDAQWSKNLDKLIAEQLLPAQTVTLYGSRDSFIKSYSGKHTVCELESTTFVSGTEVRRKVCNNYPPDKSYRAGMIAATAHRYPICYQTVDIAVLNEKNEVLLARKPDQKKLRFIGGFSDPKSTSLEADAKREVMEESGVEIADVKYIGSTLIPDERFKNEIDKLKTAFFIAKYIFGKPEGADDVAEVKWVPINKLNKDDIVPTHHVLVDMFMEKVVNVSKTVNDNCKSPTIVFDNCRPV